MTVRKKMPHKKVLPPKAHDLEPCSWGCRQSRRSRRRSISRRPTRKGTVKLTATGKKGGDPNVDCTQHDHMGRRSSGYLCANDEDALLVFLCAPHPAAMGCPVPNSSARRRWQLSVRRACLFAPGLQFVHYLPDIGN